LTYIDACCAVYVKDGVVAVAVVGRVGRQGQRVNRAEVGWEYVRVYLFAEFEGKDLEEAM